MPSNQIYRLREGGTAAHIMNANFGSANAPYKSADPCLRNRLGCWACLGHHEPGLVFMKIILEHEVALPAATAFLALHFGRLQPLDNARAPWCYVWQASPGRSALQRLSQMSGHAQPH